MAAEELVAVIERNAVAHDLIKVALNPDRLRAFLSALELSHPGSLAAMAVHLRSMTRNM